MPRLMLMRHASAGPRPPGGRDIDRPLDAAGRREAAAIGREMAARGWRPDRALASPARRARETLDAVAKALGAPIEADVLPDFYDGMEGDYAALLRAHGGEAETLLVVGHSPAVRLTVLALAEPGGRLVAAVHDNYPTAALAVIDFEGSWRELHRGHGRLAAFLRPADLDD